MKWEGDKRYHCPNRGCEANKRGGEGRVGTAGPHSAPGWYRGRRCRAPEADARPSPWLRVHPPRCCLGEGVRGENVRRGMGRGGEVGGRHPGGRLTEDVDDGDAGAGTQQPRQPQGQPPHGRQALPPPLLLLLLGAGVGPPRGSLYGLRRGDGEGRRLRREHQALGAGPSRAALPPAAAVAAPAAPPPCRLRCRSRLDSARRGPGGPRGRRGPHAPPPFSRSARL